MAEDRHHTMRYQFAAQYTAGKRVLDMACGDGKGGAFLVNCASYLGVDNDPNRIYAQCPSVCARADFRYMVADCCDTRLPPAIFDVAVALETYEHLPAGRQSAFLDEIMRLVTPCGTLILSCPLRVTGVGPWFAEHLAEPSWAELQQALEQRWPDGEWWYSPADDLGDFEFRRGEPPRRWLDAQTTDYLNSEGNPGRTVALYVGCRP